MKNFIIHLPKIPASLETATAMLEKFKEFNMSVELFEGTMGHDAVKKFEESGRILWPTTLKGADMANHPDVAAKMSAPGVKGCFDSHYRLWEKCVELNEPITIWEDDIMLIREFKPVDWKDILVVALGHPKKSTRWLHLLESPEGVPEAIFYNSPSMPGCCGYAIKPHAAKILVDTYSKKYRPADNAINRDIVNIEIHSYIMGIAKVAGKKSMTRTNFWSKYKEPQ
jgi:GR25 family glycosyltransferase involved in LPS biosynthesis